MNSGVNIAKIDDIVRMLQSNDFETEKLGLSLALEEFPEEILKHLTGWVNGYLTGNSFDDKFITCENIIKHALDYPNDDFHFWRCTVMVLHIAVRYGIQQL